MLPSGIVAFLFTDIEGSTQLWDRHPEAMRAALARHDELLRAAIAAHQGHVFKTIGDAFCAAFVTASDALAAGIDAQRSLFAEPWDQIGGLRVRMAVHVGSADERDGDYFGPTLNRVARLLAAGHGGQTLLSLSAYELVRDSLPRGQSLRDLGERRLKDLQRPERVYQVVVPGLPGDFPPLRTLDTRPNNLPAQPTLLIGREQELAAARQLLLRPEVRLLTFTGPGGSGKTRLGLQVAADSSDAFEDGVYFVPLAPISESDLVESAITRALDVRESATQTLRERLVGHLSTRSLLLVLDNFEQVLPAAPLVAELLGAAPRLKVLVTSRATLHVSGEREFPVPPLGLPDPLRLPPLDQLTQYDAVRLFVERAVAARPDFAVTHESAPSVAEICARLDGLPLAIELAAARIKFLTPAAVLGRLTDRFKLLTGGARDLPARQQTLRGAIDWSFELLGEGEQQFFRRLGVFVGGCSLDAAEQVCNAEGDLELDVFDGLASLVDKSLLRQYEQDDEPRFVMLETLREYALERLRGGGELDRLGRQHAVYFLALAEQAERELRGLAQAGWLARLRREHNNLLEALHWSEEHGEAETQVRLAGALWRFWWVSGSGEARRWLESSLERSEAVSPGLRARVLDGAGTLAWARGDYEAAAALYEAAAELYRELGDERGIALALYGLGTVAAARGELDVARGHYEQSLNLRRKAGDRWGTAVSLLNLGDLASEQGDGRVAGDLYLAGMALGRLLRDDILIAMALLRLAALALDGGRQAAAAALFREGLGLAHLHGARRVVAEGLEGLARLLTARGEMRLAARLFGGAESLRTAIGALLTPVQQAAHDRDLSLLRRQLDAAAYQAAWSRGSSEPVEQLVSEGVAQTAGVADYVASASGQEVQ